MYAAFITVKKSDDATEKLFITREKARQTSFCSYVFQINIYNYLFYFTCNEMSDATI